MPSATLCDARGAAIEVVLHGTVADDTYEVGRRVGIYQGIAQTPLELEQA